MSRSPAVVVLGGGLAGMAAALALALGGLRRITIVERGEELGGLAGTLRRDEHFYPLAYHHILHRDQTLLWLLDHLGVLPRVRWRKIRMLFRMEQGAYDLAHPLDFLRFPMSPADKLRFVTLMLRCFRKADWSDWLEGSAEELLDSWAGPGVRRALFEPLTDLKFRLPCREVSAAWLGARLHFREGSAPLGYVPGTNWTKLLCEGLATLLDEAGVEVRLRSSARELLRRDDRILAVALDTGEQLAGDLFVSTLPTEVYRMLAPADDTAHLGSIRYTAALSLICVTRQRVQPDFYWMNLPTRDLCACGIFRLEALNPTIGAPGETCLNFVTHLPGRTAASFKLDDAALTAAYLEDFRTLFDFELRPDWTHLVRLPMYSPVFVRGYRNPPVRSTTFPNLFFAGNYRTFPSIASTGTALGSGLEAGAALLGAQGMSSDVLRAVREFRLRSMRRG